MGADVVFGALPVVAVVFLLLASYATFGCGIRERLWQNLYREAE